MLVVAVAKEENDGEEGTNFEKLFDMTAFKVGESDLYTRVASVEVEAITNDGTNEGSDNEEAERNTQEARADGDEHTRYERERANEGENDVVSWSTTEASAEGLKLAWFEIEEGAEAGDKDIFELVDDVVDHDGADSFAERTQDSEK